MVIDFYRKQNFKWGDLYKILHPFLKQLAVYQIVAQQYEVQKCYLRNC